MNRIVRNTLLLTAAALITACGGKKEERRTETTSNISKINSEKRYSANVFCNEGRKIKRMIAQITHAKK